MIFTMISLREAIGKNFIRIMDARPDIGATDISKALGVHRSMVYKWRDGVNVPDPDHMEGLAKLFGVDVMEFYSSGATIITHPSRELKKYLVIPDEIVNLAAELSDDNDEVWRDIEKELKARIVERSIKQKA